MSHKKAQKAQNDLTTGHLLATDHTLAADHMVATDHLLATDHMLVTDDIARLVVYRLKLITDFVPFVPFCG
jgi:hypothetical protein